MWQLNEMNECANISLKPFIPGIYYGVYQTKRNVRYEDIKWYQINANFEIQMSSV